MRLNSIINSNLLLLPLNNANRFVCTIHCMDNTVKVNKSIIVCVFKIILFEFRNLIKSLLFHASFGKGIAQLYCMEKIHTHGREFEVLQFFLLCFSYFD